VVAFLADYLAGDLGSDDRSMLEGHLADCAECLVYLRSYRATVQSVRDLCGDDDELPAGMPDELLPASVAARWRSPGAGDVDQCTGGGQMPAFRPSSSSAGMLSR
jgi:anti-sigma factor RsiW